MSKQLNHEQFTITRDYPAAPDRVFGAFADTDRRRRWFAEGQGFQVDSFELDFRVGGSETTSFRVNTPEFTSDEIRNETRFFDIVPNERVILAYSMSNAGRPFSVSLQTITLEAQGAGTRLTLVEQVVFTEDADGVERRRHGTDELLDALAAELDNGPAAL